MFRSTFLIVFVIPVLHCRNYSSCMKDFSLRSPISHNWTAKMKPVQLNVCGWKFTYKACGKKAHNIHFTCKLDEEFSSISISLHFQEGTCTIKGFKEWWEELTQPAQPKSAQAISELFETYDIMSHKICARTSGMITETMGEKWWGKKMILQK